MCVRRRVRGRGTANDARRPGTGVDGPPWAAGPGAAADRPGLVAQFPAPLDRWTGPRVTTHPELVRAPRHPAWKGPVDSSAPWARGCERRPPAGHRGRRRPAVGRRPMGGRGPAGACGAVPRAPRGRTGSRVTARSRVRARARGRERRPPTRRRGRRPAVGRRPMGGRGPAGARGAVPRTPGPPDRAPGDRAPGARGARTHPAPESPPWTLRRRVFPPQPPCAVASRWRWRSGRSCGRRGRPGPGPRTGPRRPSR
ncbi:hypothetical protein FBY37_4099 [Streptomyces sp. SLBN-134]|nr:hypothetical protein FBY37_4099 [Streptomyces sp. SLBN-134]